MQGNIAETGTLPTTDNGENSKSAHLFEQTINEVCEI